MRVHYQMQHRSTREAPTDFRPSYVEYWAHFPYYESTIVAKFKACKSVIKKKEDIP